MQNIKKNIIIIIITFVAFKTANAQQNIQFTQYMFNSLSVNPAYAGYKEEWFVQSGLRTQWVGIDGAPKTGSLSVDGIIDPEHKKMGIGLQLTGDKLGPQSSVSGYLNYAYRLQLDAFDTKRLSFGLGVGVTNYSLDGGILNSVVKNDPSVPISQFSNFIPDARVGVYYNTNKFYTGVSISDLFSGGIGDNLVDVNSVTYSNIKRKRNLYFIMGTLHNLNEELKLRPSILVKEDFRGPTSLDINTMFIFKDKFWLGASYRTALNAKFQNYSQGQYLTSTNAMSAVMQIFVTDELRVGYSYDYTLNGLRTQQSGAHEITIGLTLPRKNQRILSPRYF
ncbi:MAG: type IX secretion system membrane protein PorP/SprF [Sphingobacteriales bacterium]|nr:MAG: type IX secretion system membrane protein PorP/SprF [Sphingobacteriales bacterium]TAF78432.1 MAG: type IX secretion system membrane protein PorP/SprF [Sphingobacteriales bacterium]